MLQDCYTVNKNEYNTVNKWRKSGTSFELNTLNLDFAQNRQSN